MYSVYEHQPSQMITKKKLPEIFKASGLPFLDNDLIPANLRSIGWETEIFQKEVSDGVVLLQTVYGPNSIGEKVGRRRDVLHIKPDGSVVVFWEKCEHEDECRDLMQAFGFGT